jgi:hypothetical protein
MSNENLYKMKQQLYLLILLTFGATYSALGQSILDLGPSQSMSVTGKGPGQDAVKNPYSNSKSIAIIENIGPNSFEIRTQENGKILEIFILKPKKIKKIKLSNGVELYIDSRLESKASVAFMELLN